MSVTPGTRSVYKKLALAVTYYTIMEVDQKESAEEEEVDDVGE
jgi:hypothetical protein